MKAIFKVGDTITPKELHWGIEKATVIKIENGNYHLKIPCGIAIIPIKAQDNYKLNTD